MSFCRDSRRCPSSITHYKGGANGFGLIYRAKRTSTMQSSELPFEDETNEQYRVLCEGWSLSLTPGGGLRCVQAMQELALRLQSECAKVPPDWEAKEVKDR